MKKWKITEEMKQAAKNVFAAMAWVETVKPIVNGYKKKILNENVFNFDGEKKRIINIKNDYRMSNVDFDNYLHLCNIERKKAGLTVENEEFCPLLVAEKIESDTKIILCDVMEPVTGIKYWNVSKNFKSYRKYFDLILGLLAPYIDQHYQKK